MPDTYSKNIVYLSKAQYQELIANQTITVNGTTVTYNENDIYVTPQAEPVTDVRVAGTSVAANGVANIPMASTSTTGVVKLGSGTATGLRIESGLLKTDCAGTTHAKGGTNNYMPIVPAYQHASAFYGLATASGDTTQSQSSNAVGSYTPEAKAAIQSMLGVSDLIATEENNLIASKAYKVGDVFTANGKLYKATAAIAADAAIIPEVEGEEITGANCEETSVGEGFPHDVQVNGESVVSDGVANIPLASKTNAGAVKVGNGFFISPNNPDILNVDLASLNQIKNGDGNSSVRASQIAEIAFYGLAKAAGANEKNSTLPAGQYTDTAKGAIRGMLGATSSNVIAVQDTQPTDTDTKIWLPETAPEGVEVPTMADMNAALAGKVGDVQVDGQSVVSNGIAEIPKIGTNRFGVAQVNGAYGVGATQANYLYIVPATDVLIKTGTDAFKPIVSSNEHQAAFYGLAKAAGDTTQSASDNAVGTYTDEAKSAIRTMLGAVGSEDYATSSTFGIVKPGNGLLVNSSNVLSIATATEAQCKSQNGSTGYQPITVFNQHAASFYGLATAAGDTTQKASSNAVGIYTDNAKASIKAMLGIQDGSTGTVDITGTTPTITAVENTRYVCGEVTSLSFTPPASGISIVRFTSGSTVTVLTIPSTVKFPEWFDPTSLETNTIYEICVTDGIYGAVMSWAL